MEKLSNEDVLLVLRSLGLAFHVGRLGDRNMDAAQRREFYSLPSGAEYDDFEEVKKLGEVLEQVFDSHKVSLSSPEHTFPDHWYDLKKSLRQARTESSLGLYRELKRILSVAEPEDASRLQRLLGGEGAIEPLLLRFSQDPVAAIEHLLTAVESKDFMETATKYANGPTAGHASSICPSGLCRATNRLEYLQAFVACWTAYVKRAREKQPPETRIDNGFSLSTETMEQLLARYPQA